jgi:hypothetical protein
MLLLHFLPLPLPFYLLSLSPLSSNRSHAIQVPSPDVTGANVCVYPTQDELQILSTYLLDRKLHCVRHTFLSPLMSSLLSFSLLLSSLRPLHSFSLSSFFNLFLPLLISSSLFFSHLLSSFSLSLSFSLSRVYSILLILVSLELYVFVWDSCYCCAALLLHCYCTVISLYLDSISLVHCDYTAIAL